MANFDSTDGPKKYIPKVSQKTLAEMVGTTRTRINFFMNQFRKKGLINYNGHIEVSRSLAKVVMSNQDAQHKSAQSKQACLAARHPTIAGIRSGHQDECAGDLPRYTWVE